MTDDDSSQRVGVISRLPHVLWQLGTDPGAVFEASGVAPAAIEDPDGALSFPDLDRLLGTAAFLSGCPHLGLLIGGTSALAFLGPVGELMRHAPTLRRGLLDLTENQHRYVKGSVVYFIDHGDTAMLGYAVDFPGFVSIDQLTEGALASGIRFVEQLSGRPPLEVLLPRSQPVNTAPYARICKAPVRFGQEHAGLVLDGRVLDLPVKGADPALRSVMETFVRSYWAVREPTTAQMVRRILRGLVLTSEADLDTVASRLGIHPRTLHRRLVGEGTSFRRVLEEIRFAVAQQLLLGTNVSITQLALWLGYSEAAAFSHAFRRWAGTSALEWRADNQRGRSGLSAANNAKPSPDGVRKDQDAALCPHA